MLEIFRTFSRKVQYKLFGVVHVPPIGKKKGDVLLSYLPGPLTLFPWQHFTDPHSNYWESSKIAQMFSERGYAVDVIDFKNTAFIPRKSYIACIDIGTNLHRFLPYLPKTCKKIIHITGAYPEFQSRQAGIRLTSFEKRRGTRITQERPVPNASYKDADYLEGFGNKTIRESYAPLRMPIFPIPISVTTQFDFPEQKDFIAARTNFLWFGGSGAILKGLDLVLEAFAELPEYTLHIVGPVIHEEKFKRTYARELSLPNIRLYPRPQISKGGKIMVGSQPFTEITNACASIVYPSASEGTSGAVIQAMHAGLIPLITKETGIEEGAPGIVIEPTKENILAAVRTIATQNSDELRAHAKNVWQWVRAHHTKETFSRAYARFIDEVLQM